MARSLSSTLVRHNILRFTDHHYIVQTCVIAAVAHACLGTKGCLQLLITVLSAIRPAKSLTNMSLQQKLLPISQTVCIVKRIVEHTICLH